MDRIVASDARVAIVGAGPVGLSMALGLARQQVRSVLIEKKNKTSEYSKAPGIHVRTREIFRQWGIEQTIREAGVLRQELAIHSAHSNRALARLDFTELADEADRPGLLVLEQGETEKLLLDAVRGSGLCDVHFSTEAIQLTQTRDELELKIQQSGRQQRLSFEYLIACDGAGSFVRDALKLPFDGITYSIRAMLADVRLNDERDELPWPRFRNAAGGMTVGIQLREGLWRIIRIEPGEVHDGDRVADEELNQRVEDVLGSGSFETVWASRFRIHRRSIPHFRVGRVLFAGDAAHVHSPIGGQGMNSGIQDAHNLAWKLANVLRGGEVDRLLESYDVERRAVVVGSVTRYTDFLTRTFLQTPALLRNGAFLLLRPMLALPSLRRAMLRRTAMIDLDYRESPIVDPTERAAGKRLPNPRLRSSDGNELRLYDLLKNECAMIQLADTARDDHPVAHVVRIGAGAYTDESRLLHKVLDGPTGWILVRPDLHIAWARDRWDGIEPATHRALGG